MEDEIDKKGKKYDRADGEERGKSCLGTGFRIHLTFLEKQDMKGRIKIN